MISATLHLAQPAEAIAADTVRRLDQQLRDLEYHPDRYLGPLYPWNEAPVDIEHWLALKSRWLKTDTDARERARTLPCDPRGQRSPAGVDRARAA